MGSLMAKPGRPPGSKNKPNHNAGGDRKSAKAKKQKPLQRGKLTLQPDGDLARPQQVPRRRTEPTVVARQKTEEELLQEQSDRENRAREMLRKVLKHPSSKCGGKVFADDDDHGNNEYDTDTEEDNDANSTQKRYRRA